jgi:O-methyltransferase involved in polyketide biosynthesis
VCTKCRKWLQLLLTLKQYHKDGDEFLSHIIQVTGDKTWVSFVNVETKEQSKQWMHAHSPNKLKKFKQTSARKLMAVIFWDRRGMLVEFMKQRTTVTSEVYCKTLKMNCIGPFRIEGVEC